MSNKQETIEDIVAAMRNEGHAGNASCLEWVSAKFTSYANRIEAAHRREVEELRECLKEAIREKCPFTRMSCKHGEPCDYECGTVKWRKALQDEGGAK